jgi:hypothetical protein
VWVGLQQKPCTTSNVLLKPDINAYAISQEVQSDTLLEHFLKKKIPEFWKCWNTKFRRNVGSQVVINGLSINIDIANEFANHFSSVYVPSHAEATVKDFSSDFTSHQSHAPREFDSIQFRFFNVA